MTPLAELSSRHPEYRKAHKQLTTVARRNGEVAGGSRQRWKDQILQQISRNREADRIRDARIDVANKRLDQVEGHLQLHDKRLQLHGTHLAGCVEKVVGYEKRIAALEKHKKHT